jgi:hypothetical protein
MKLFSIGSIAIATNLFVGLVNTVNVEHPFSILGALALVSAGVLIGMSVLERFVRN